MKKVDVKLLAVAQNTDVEAELKELGQAGWSFKFPMVTPFGVKFILERTLDDDVDPSLLSDELAKKFGIS